MLTKNGRSPSNYLSSAKRPFLPQSLVFPKPPPTRGFCLPATSPYFIWLDGRSPLKSSAIPQNFARLLEQNQLRLCAAMENQNLKNQVGGRSDNKRAICGVLLQSKTSPRSTPQVDSFVKN
jgi:hypothetical protein